MHNLYNVDITKSAHHRKVEGAPGQPNHQERIDAMNTTNNTRYLQEVHALRQAHDQLVKQYNRPSFVSIAVGVLFFALPVAVFFMLQAVR